MSYQLFSFTNEEKNKIEIVKLKGYLEDSGGAQLKAHILKRLDEGISLFAFDFSDIELISSPGVAALLDIGGMVVDDFAGNVAVWGIDKHHSAVLEMSGLFFLFELVADEAEALEFLESAQ